MKKSEYPTDKDRAFGHIRIGEYKGILLTQHHTPTVIKGLHRFFNSGWSMEKAVACADDRDVHRHRFDDGAVVYIKRYHVSGIKPCLRSLFNVNKAQKAWRTGRRLRLKGVDTPLPIALLKHRKTFFSYEYLCITKGLTDAVALRDIIHLQSGKEPVRGIRKRSLIGKVAEFVAGLHTHNIYHGDFTADNILLRNSEAGNEMRIYLIDLDAVRTGFRISDRRRVKNLDELGRNFLDLRIISTADRARFLKYYLLHYPCEKRTLKQLFKVVQQRTEHRLKIHQRFFVKGFEDSRRQGFK